MYLLTNFEDPNPWSREEVLVYVAELRAELRNPRYHTYQFASVYREWKFDSTQGLESQPRGMTELKAMGRN
ncbi:hypothetical protein N7490_007378 [Penicillium lividum]|nr:hypothetical protein N7490_007378 [Penicillium lividum]